MYKKRVFRYFFRNKFDFMETETNYLCYTANVYEVYSFRFFNLFYYLKAVIYKS